MLRFFTDSPVNLTRREWLRIGAGGLGLAGLHASEGSTAPGSGKARSVIVVFASGGQSQLDTWDPKPDAPQEVRGAFRSIASSVPGTRLCEHLPRLARLANLGTIVRTVAHDDLDHGSACYLSLTGQFHPRKSSNPPPRPSDQPALGAHRPSRFVLLQGCPSAASTSTVRCSSPKCHPRGNTADFSVAPSSRCRLAMSGITLRSCAAWNRASMSRRCA